MAVPRKYKPLLAREGGGGFDKWARRNYGVTGYGLLARLIQGESGWNPNAVSSAGARGLTQFIPSTRQAFIRQHGIDPWKNPENMVKAAKIHLTKYGGLRGYNPGMASYSSYILGQDVGNVYRTLRKQGFLDPGGVPTGSRGGSGGGGGSSPPRTGSRPSGGLSAPLGAVLGQSAQLTAPQDPEFSARRHLQFPEQGKDSPSSAPPSPSASVGDRLKLSGGTVPALSGLPSLSHLGLQNRLAPGVPTPGFTDVAAARGKTITTPEGKRYKWNGRGWLLLSDPKDPGYRGGGPDKSEGGSNFHGGGGWAGTKNVVLHGLGDLPASNFKRTPAHNQAVGGSPTSDHLTTNRDAYAADTTFGTGRQIAKRLGIKGWQPGTYERYTIRAAGGKRYSVQILERVKGHFDHTHVGVQRIR